MRGAVSVLPQGRKAPWRSTPGCASQDFAEATCRAGASAPRSRASTPTTALGPGSHGSAMPPAAISSGSGKYRNDGSTDRGSTTPGAISWGMRNTSVRKSRSAEFPIGWFASAAGKVAVGKFRPDWFRVVGEITGNYKKISPLGYDIALSSYSFMGGTKFTARNWKRLLPFAQFLVGGAIERVTSSDLDIHGSMTRFAFAPGGGVDLTLTSRVAARVGANERFVRIGSQTTNQFQLLVGGVVFWK